MSQRKGLGRDPFAVLDTRVVAAPSLVEVPALSEVDLETITINVADIEVDENFNARTIYDEAEIASLAESIQKEGLLNPVTVRHRPHRKPSYFLVAGFKRLRALRSLDVKNVPARLCRAERDADAYLLNLAENTSGRSDLTAADIAQRCAWLSENYALSGAEIAERVKLSKPHVNNLIRINRQLHPDVLSAFRANHASAKVQRLVALSSRSHDEQLKTWNEMVRMDSRADAHAEKEPAKAAEPRGEAEGRARPTARIIHKAIEALGSQSASEAEEWRRGFSEALRWVLGEADAPPLGVDLTVRRGRPAVGEG